MHIACRCQRRGVYDSNRIRPQRRHHAGRRARRDKRRPKSSETKLAPHRAWPHQAAACHRTGPRARRLPCSLSATGPPSAQPALEACIPEQCRHPYLSVILPHGKRKRRVLALGLQSAGKPVTRKARRSQTRPGHLGIDVHAGLQQQLDALEMSVHGRTQQRRTAFVIALARIGAG